MVEGEAVPVAGTGVPEVTVTDVVEGDSLAYILMVMIIITT